MDSSALYYFLNVIIDLEFLLNLIHRATSSPMVLRRSRMVRKTVYLSKRLTNGVVAPNGADDSVYLSS
jgi:hypothetical protein